MKIGSLKTCMRRRSIEEEEVCSSTTSMGGGEIRERWFSSFSPYEMLNRPDLSFFAWFFMGVFNYV